MIVSEEGLARIAGQHGSPQEWVLRSHADDEVITFRGWKMGEAEGVAGPGVDIRTEAVVWLTSDRKAVIAFRDFDEGSRSPDFEAEYLFVARCGSREEAERWIDTHAGFQGSTRDQEYVVMEAWREALSRFGPEA